jgi:hypothetical protein
MQTYRMESWMPWYECIATLAPSNESILVVVRNALPLELAAKLGQRLPRARFVTIAKLAYAANPHLAKRLVPKLSLPGIKRRYGIQSWHEANDVLSVLDVFFQSGIEGFYENQPTRNGMGMKTAKGGIQKILLDVFNGRPDDFDYQRRVIFTASKIWSSIKDGTAPISFDALIKLYQFTVEPPREKVFVMRGEDLTGCELTTLLKMAPDASIIGDPLQKIFKGFYDLDFNLDMTEVGIEHSQINGAFASVLQTLRTMLNESKPLIFDDSGIGAVVAVSQLKMASLNPVIITRTNIGVIEEALDCQRKGIPFSLVGGASKYGIDDLFDLLRFRDGNLEQIISKSLVADFGTYDNYVRVAKEVGDRDMNRLIRLVTEVPELEKNLVSLVDDSNRYEKGPCVKIGTVFKLKGHLFNAVTLSSELFAFEKEDAEACRLIYCALLLAKKVIALPDDVIIKYGVV